MSGIKRITNSQNDMTSLVWYAVYGSNLSRDRFLCYIKGGTPLGAKQKEKGCSNKTSPRKDKLIEIHYPLYFAKYSKRWCGGGVAFIGLTKVENDATLGRMYLVTKDQFIDVFKQENSNSNIPSNSIDLIKARRDGSLIVDIRSCYSNIIYLNDCDGFPVFTFTASCDIKDTNEFKRPSNKYLKTLCIGIRESWGLNDETIAEYLANKRGIKEFLTKDELLCRLSGLSSYG